MQARTKKTSNGHLPSPATMLSGAFFGLGLGRSAIEAWDTVRRGPVIERYARGIRSLMQAYVLDRRLDAAVAGEDPVFSLEDIQGNGVSLESAVKKIGGDNAWNATLALFYQAVADGGIPSIQAFRAEEKLARVLADRETFMEKIPGGRNTVLAGFVILGALLACRAQRPPKESVSRVLALHPVFS